MANSNLLGGEALPIVPPGHDSSSLGPSDTSDSGSDVVGAPEPLGDDPGLPADIALDPDYPLLDAGLEELAAGADSDAGGTGERRSASGDAGTREAPDISPDHLIIPPREKSGQKS